MDWRNRGPIPFFKYAENWARFGPYEVLRPIFFLLRKKKWAHFGPRDVPSPTAMAGRGVRNGGKRRHQWRETPSHLTPHPSPLFPSPAHLPAIAPHFQVQNPNAREEERGRRWWGRSTTSSGIHWAQCAPPSSGQRPSPPRSPEEAIQWRRSGARTGVPASSSAPFCSRKTDSTRWKINPCSLCSLFMRVCVFVPLLHRFT